MHPADATGLIAEFAVGYMNWAYTLGCIERLCKKIKIGILMWPSNRQVPYDMGSRKVQKFLKIFHVLRCPQRAKVSEKLEIFIKMAFFLS